MKYNTWTNTTTTAVTTIDLRTNQNDDEKISGHTLKLANFDIEVIGNDAEVTLTAKGAFPTSDFVSVTDGTFAISGAKKSISGFSISELKFTRVGTTSYTINIVRRLEE